MVARSEVGAYPQITDLAWDDPFIRLRSSTMPLKDDKGKVVGFMKIIRDRTREISLLKGKNEFLTIASHQLRTPITNVKWSLENLAGEPGLSDSAMQLVRSAQQGAAYLLSVAEDLLRTSKIEEGRFGYDMKEVDLVSFVERLINSVSAQAEEAGVKLYMERPKSALPAVIGDEQKLSMVFENLLDNAIRYNVANGEVVVRLEPLPSQPFIQVSIRDTGIGIPPNDLPKLFKKFSRGQNVVKSQTDGTGLGLYIVKNIIQSHGGRISASSELGRGTTFMFTLTTNKALVPAKETIQDY